ncbi:MAG: stage II sporulation protein R [Clostridia bacterium]|nr:stage II sporulation protein R [Clostridia bacterium]
MKKICYTLAFLIMTAALIAAWSEKPLEELENNIVRLHIIAAGDGERDQELKLMVRDSIQHLAAERGRLPSAAEMELTANSVLKKEGVKYGARVTMGKFYITRRSYGSFTLPYGRYTAARVELGPACGKNWWCVLSPPLCFTSSSFDTEDTLDGYVSSSTEKIIEDGDINIKFRALELISRLKQKTEQRKAGK